MRGPRLGPGRSAALIRSETSAMPTDNGHWLKNLQCTSTLQCGPRPPTLAHISLTREGRPSGQLSTDPLGNFSGFGFPLGTGYPGLRGALFVHIAFFVIHGRAMLPQVTARRVTRLGTVVEGRA
jgi:hypothetical protein